MKQPKLGQWQGGVDSIADVEQTGQYTTRISVSTTVSLPSSFHHNTGGLFSPIPQWRPTESTFNLRTGGG